MLSIALIAAALLIASWMLQWRYAPEERAVTDIKPFSNMPANTLKPSGAAQGVVSRPVVALVLRVENPDCACETARKYADRTYKVGEAPKLPFKDCERSDCQCRYLSITERRTRGERRVRANRREEIRFETKDDRRSGKDRRQTNNVWKRPV
jgi:hypothetical protein